MTPWQAGLIDACEIPSCNARARGGSRRIRAFCPHEAVAWAEQRARMALASAHLDNRHLEDPVAGCPRCS